MNKFSSLLIFIITVFLFFLSCVKKIKPPIAKAGADQVITLPTDSILLDGSASNDPDGTISVWRWTKISGPSSFQIVNPSITKTGVKNLDTGVYRFELKVIDDENLSATDTVQIIVTDSRPLNRPPVANAGADQSITLPTNTVNLDGNASTDPDNNINSYLWTKISGPSSFAITNASAVQTQATNLAQGSYQFELKVTDAGGLLSKDTMQVTVNAQPPPPPTATCEPLNRQLVNAQLIPVGNLSMARDGMGTITADNKIFFAGGYTSSGNYGRVDVSRVDIYDVLTQTWSQAELSVPRSYIAAVATGDKVFFAGGSVHSASNLTAASSRVDIYNVTTQTWSIAELSQARGEIAAAVVGNKVFFAGGYMHLSSPGPPSSRVDIFDISTQTWSTAELTEERGAITAVTAQNKIYFAGGDLGGGMGTSNKIDIYDNDTGVWSVSSLNEGKAFFAGIHKNGKIYWAGGATYFDLGGGAPTSCKVEIRDLNSQDSTFANLFEPNAFIKAYEKNNKIIFINHDGPWDYYFGLSWSFDIYDLAANSWSIGTVNQSSLPWPGSWISHNNIIYLAGGKITCCSYSSQVWKLEF